jgi:hypothetical protein
VLGEEPAAPPCPPEACPAVVGAPLGFAEGELPALHPQAIAPTTSTTIAIAT